MKALTVKRESSDWFSIDIFPNHEFRILRFRRIYLCVFGIKVKLLKTIQL